MAIATSIEILRVFPSLPDHAVTRIEDMEATVSELDAALLLLSSDDVDLIEAKQRHGHRLNRLIAILLEAGVEGPEEERTR